MLKEKISSDLKESLKSGDASRLSVLRMLISAVNNRKIEKRAKIGVEAELTDEEVLEVVAKEAKKRKEAIELFNKGDRGDLAAGEKAELEILAAYLPEQMGEAEIKKTVGRIVAASGAKEFGPAMKEVMKELKGKADSALITKALKEILG